MKGMTDRQHDEREGHQRDEQIHGPGEDRGHHEDGAWHVDLPDERPIAQEAVGGPRRRLREEVPQHEG